MRSFGNFSLLFALTLSVFIQDGIGDTLPLTATNTSPLSTHALVTSRSGTTSSPVTPYVDDPDFLDTFTYQILTPPVNGTAVVDGNNRLVYTPNIDITSGLDSFIYRATDSAGQVVDGTARVRIYANSVGSAAGLGRCTTASTVSDIGALGIRTNSGGCAIYSEAITRITSTGTPVTVRYTVHRPSNGALPKAVVYLIAGGQLNANFVGGDATTGSITSAGGNFLVRSAQLIAEAGYLAVVMDRPSDRSGIPPNTDNYRVSVDHAVDILTLLRRVNTDKLPVILAGTSRGALSVVANNLIAAGLHISSPVTSGTGTQLYVGIAGRPNLQAAYVQRPTHVLWHQDDLCPVSTPAKSLALFNNLIRPGFAFPSKTIATDGVRVTTPSTTVQPDVCGAFDYHGFLGIEPTIIAIDMAILDNFVASLVGNTAPDAAFVSMSTSLGNAAKIDLSTITRSAKKNRLAYALPHAMTSLGGRVTLRGTKVTYTPPAAITNRTDYFVYVVTDRKGGVNAAVVTVKLVN